MSKNPLDKLEGIKGDDRKEVSALRKRIRELESQIEKQQAQIERERKSRYKLPKAANHAKNRAAYSRVVIPDTHGCYGDEKALAAFLRDLEGLSANVREIVMLGDHVDCGGFLAQHHVLGYVAETTYTYEDDFNATNTLLDEVQRICPKAAIHYLEGNHERRIQVWCVDQAKGSTRQAEYLLRQHGTEAVLHLAKRGVNFYQQGQFYDGCAIPATVKLGKCYFTHGSRTGHKAAAPMLRDFGAPVVFGHIHRIDNYSGRTVTSEGIQAWCPGCLCRQQPLWMHTQITSWSHGYGLQLVRDDGDFLHVNVPILDGKSYLMQLTESGV